jgi:hypothetical protein
LDNDYAIAVDKTEIQNKINMVTKQQWNLSAEKNELESKKQSVLEGQPLWDKWRSVYLKQVDEENRLQSEWQKSKDEADSLAGWLEENQRKADIDSGQLQNWPLVESQTYFAGLPTPLAVAKTDADGKFSFQLPTKDEFVLVAQAQRQVPDNVEKYFWLIRVHSDGKPEMQVMLSNDNLITANSPDVAVRFPAP